MPVVILALPCPLPVGYLLLHHACHTPPHPPTPPPHYPTTHLTAPIGARHTASTRLLTVSFSGLVAAVYRSITNGNHYLYVRRYTRLPLEPALRTCCVSPTLPHPALLVTCTCRFAPNYHYPHPMHLTYLHTHTVDGFAYRALARSSPARVCHPKRTRGAHLATPSTVKRSLTVGRLRRTGYSTPARMPPYTFALLDMELFLGQHHVVATLNVHGTSSPPLDRRDRRWFTLYRLRPTTGDADAVLVCACCGPGADYRRVLLPVALRWATHHNFLRTLPSSTLLGWC